MPKLAKQCGHRRDGCFGLRTVLLAQSRLHFALAFVVGRDVVLVMVRSRMVCSLTVWGLC